MVGSGPFVCNPSKGVSTISGQASCSQNANGSPGGQALGPGGRILLKRNHGYMRCCPDGSGPINGLSTSSLQALEWANFAKNGKVGITDIASAASVFGKDCSFSTLACYYAHPLYASNPSTGTVDIGDIATVAQYFDHGLTAPYAPSFNGQTLVQYTSNVDPGQFIKGTSTLYFEGAYIVSGSLRVKLVLLAGPPPSASDPIGCFAETGGTINIKGDHDKPNNHQHLLIASAPITTPTTIMPAGCTLDMDFATGPNLDGSWTEVPYGDGFYNA